MDDRFELGPVARQIDFTLDIDIEEDVPAAELPFDEKKAVFDELAYREGRVAVILLLTRIHQKMLENLLHPLHTLDNRNRGR